MDERDYIALNKDVVKITPTELVTEKIERLESELMLYSVAINNQFHRILSLEKENEELRQQIVELTKSKTK